MMKVRKSLTILALDCAGKDIHLALASAGKIRTKTLTAHSGMQGPFGCLIPEIENLVHTAGLSLKDIRVIATTAGPGSFTGLRAGLATAQGLCYGLKAQPFCPTTLSLSMFRYGQCSELKGKTVIVGRLQQAQKYYLQEFEGIDTPLCDIFMGSLDEIQSILTENREKIFVDATSFSLAETLIHYYHYLSENDKIIPQTFKPQYIIEPIYQKLSKYRD